MIRIEAIQLRRLAADVIRQLDVADTVETIEVRELTDGTWLVTFADHFPDTRFPAFEISIEADWSLEQAARELRVALRAKLWICPLCQRRAQIRRIVDREAFRVACDRCGGFEIENDLLNYLRLAYEEHEAGLGDQLTRLSAFVARTGGMPLLTAENWRALAAGATP